MCMHCSMMCDKCKPAESKAFKCGACGKATILSRADCLYTLGYWKLRKPAKNGEPNAPVATCRGCGKDLTEEVKQTVLPKYCRYSEIICAYPCKRSERLRDPRDKPCKRMVLARKKKVDAH